MRLRLLINRIGPDFARWTWFDPALCLRVIACLVLFGKIGAVAAEDRVSGDRLPSVISINLCADQLALLLAEPSQILALSTLSREESGSVFHEQASTYPQADTRAETILKYAPDIVLTGPYTSRYTLSLLAELGVRVEHLGVANSLADMLDNLTLVGTLLNQESKATLISQQVAARLESIHKQVSALGTASANTPRAAVYDANGYTVGNKTVRGEALELAGWRNVALEREIDSYGVLGLEDLVALRPDALMESPYSAETYSRGQQLTRHPAIRSAGIDPLIINIPSNKTICAGPWTVDIVEQLLESRMALVME